MTPSQGRVHDAIKAACMEKIAEKICENPVWIEFEGGYAADLAELKAYAHDFPGLCESISDPWSQPIDLADFSATTGENCMVHKRDVKRDGKLIRLTIWNQ